MPRLPLTARHRLGSDAGVDGDVGITALAPPRVVPGEHVELAHSAVLGDMEHAPAGPFDPRRIADRLIDGEELAHDRLGGQLTGLAQLRDGGEVAGQGGAGHLAHRVGDLAVGIADDAGQRDLGVDALGQHAHRSITHQAERERGLWGIDDAQLGVAFGPMTGPRLGGNLRGALPAIITAQVSGAHAHELLAGAHRPGRRPHGNVDARITHRMARSRDASGPP